MSCLRVDHVALWVEDPEPHAAFCVEHLGMHVIARTDAFTLVGADARRGKLTFFAAPGEREWSPLDAIALYRASGAPDRWLAGAEGLALRLIDPIGHRDGDLARVTLRVPRAEDARAAFAALGFVEDCGRLWLGDTELALREGPDGPGERPSHLNHLGLLVDSAEEEAERARSLGFEIDRFVDAENTLAAFVRGPDGVLVEYVEHKATFALT